MNSKSRAPLATMMLVRQVHACVGMLIAPSVIFFAATGALQLYSLHEARGAYTPPPLIEKLGRVHKDQVFSAAPHRGPPPAAKAQAAAGAARQGPPEAKRQKLSTAVLKAFFLLVALSLIGSTCVGVWIALTHPRNRRLYVALLAVGAVLPLAILMLP